MAISNYLSIDVEDYFQVSAFEQVSPRSCWDSQSCRVEHNVDLILEMLAVGKTRATFFVLGWIADRYPQMVRKISTLGHEIASHGYSHQRVSRQDRLSFRSDIRISKALLEDLTGFQVYGYRAPSYSISHETDWAFDELLEAGYHYDSSIFPIRHDLYGIADWPRFSGYAVKGADGTWHCAPEAKTGTLSLRELPISTLAICGMNLPIAGGGYFRLLPYAVTRWGLWRVNRQDKKPFVFYLHPWELDPAQPRMAHIRLKSRFRHYLNLHKTEGRFSRLLKDFEFTSISQGFGSMS